MRGLWMMLAILAAMHGASGWSAELTEPAGQLVREVVYNEQHDHQHHGAWRFWIERKSSSGTQLEDAVETAEGPVYRLALSNGEPLSAEAQEEERARLDRLLSSPAEQARHLRQYQEDEDRIGRILGLLPDAFLYEYSGEVSGCYRLLFHPNPNYPPATIEARIFHSMSGELWIDARMKRLVRLEGRVGENVDFGFGILGRLYKGGWFRLVRVQVSPTDWKTESLEVHMNLRALLVKSFARETSEMRGGFEAVPSGMTLAQGVAILDKPPSGIEAQADDRKLVGKLIGTAALEVRP